MLAAAVLSRWERQLIALIIVGMVLACILWGLAATPRNAFKAQCVALGGHVVRRNLEPICLGPDGLVPLE